MNPRVWCFDLEMNKPSGKIIQVGALVGDLRNGRILQTFNQYVNPQETLDPFIIDLTGITQEVVDQADSLSPVKRQLEAFVTEFKACRSPVVWGNGDLRCLKGQALEPGFFQGTHRELDIKTIHQVYCLSNGLSMRGGLEKALEVHGMKFKGTPHNALDDAINTFRLACHVFSLLRKVTSEPVLHNS